MIDDLDSRFYVMDMEDSHLGDLLHDIAEMLRPYSTALGDPMDPRHVLTAIVDEEDGGIIAYAIGEANARRIAVALEDVEGRE